MRLRWVFFSLLKVPIFNYLYWKAYKLKVKRTIKKGFTGLSIEGNNVCNYACTMCPYKEMTRPKKVMSLELFMRILGDAKEVGLRMVNLSIYNEPFLDPLLFDRLSIARAMGFKTSFYSNGSMMDSENIRKLLRHPPDKIFFSLDAFKSETYRKVRVNGNLIRTRKNILNLIKKRDKLRLDKPKVYITFSIQKLNEGELPKFRRFWKDKADAVFISTADNRAGNMEELSRKVDKSPKFVFPCIRLFNSIQVLSNGEVVMCCMDYDGKYVIGDLKKQKITEVFESDRFKKMAKLNLNRKANKHPLCSNCDELYRCSPYIWWSN